MKFGLQVGFPDWKRLRDVAQAAESLGFHSIYFPDHLVHEGPERQRDDHPAYDPMVQAAVVAEATRLAARHADGLTIRTGRGSSGYIALADARELSDGSFGARVRFAREEPARHGRDGRAIAISQTLFTPMLPDAPQATRALAESFG